jgi:hypothetical protein
MKKKLEAELISIAHRILKLKNRAELDQLQQETLKLYEKLSVLRFVEDNFSEVKPTINFASAEEKLEEVYGLEETPEPVAEDVKATAKTDDIKEDKPEEKAGGTDFNERQTDSKDQDKETVGGEGVDTEEGTDESPASKEEVQYTQEEAEKQVPDNDVKQEVPAEEPKAEPVAQPEKPAEQEKPLFNFEQRTEEPKKQKEITFEDYHDYKEPEFVKKSDVAAPASINKEWLPKEPEVIQKQEEKAKDMWQEPKQEEKPATTDRKWQDWEPQKSAEAPKREEPKNAEIKPAVTKTLNDSLGKTISLGLNDRIAFEKNLFGGSGEDLNRVLSQLNTFDTFAHARDFITDMVKPDYNNWNGKEEYEERFMAIVEQKFN